MNPIIDEDYISNIFPNIKDWIELRMKESSQSGKIYFSGEFDSNQSEFERKSNHLEIGVICNDKSAALVLLCLLRVIIDERIDILIFRIENYFEEKGCETNLCPAIIEEICLMLGERESQYGLEFNLNDDITVTLNGYDSVTKGSKETVIIKQLYEIDVWTPVRIFKEMTDYI